MVYGIGTDIVELERIEKVGLERLAQRILTSDERARMKQRVKQRTEYVASRFAAKEAVSKALGVGIGKQLGFQDIQIDRNDRGAPIVRLQKEVKERFFGEKEIVIHLSLSHCKKYAVAMVVIEEMER